MLSASPVPMSSAPMSASPTPAQCLIDEPAQLPFTACASPCHNLTVVGCAMACASQFKQAALFGLRNGTSCTCGASLAHPEAKSPLAQCNSSCAGSDRELHCGGEARVWVAPVADFTPPKSGGPLLVDPRNICDGTTMLESGYLDQPYCQHDAQRGGPSGRLVCLVTSQRAHEGGNGEHVVSISSHDLGATWSAPVVLEPHSGGIDSSYSTLALSHKTGRFLAIYNMNLDNVTRLPSGKPAARTDELGHFVMRWSDDGARSWSAQRVEVPYRLTALDRHNTFHGKVRLMWNVDQVKALDDGSVVWAFTKIGSYVQSPPEEVWLLRSPNLLSVDHPADATFELLPSGDVGLPPPGGNPSVMEEGHVLPLPAGGGFYVVARTSQGYLAAAHTADPTARAGWTPTEYAQYLDQRSPAQRPRPLVGNGTALKNPRAPITMKTFQEGRRALMLYNNNHCMVDSGYFCPTHPRRPPFTEPPRYGARDPYFLTAGTAVPGHGWLWSQPELVLYDRHNFGGTSAGGYPDLFELPEGSGAVHITETQKATARMHTIEPALLEGLWAQHTASYLPGGGIPLDAGAGARVAVPRVDDFRFHRRPRAGFSLQLWLAAHRGARHGDVLFTTRTPASPAHVSVEVLSDGGSLASGPGLSIALRLTDQHNVSVLGMTDPRCTARLDDAGAHSIGIVVDGAPGLVFFLVDGHACDGGGVRDLGFLWLPLEMADVSGASTATVAPRYGGHFLGGTYWPHALRTSALIAAWRHGAPAAAERATSLARAVGRRTRTLNGDGRWQWRGASWPAHAASVPAMVPGELHFDLVRAGAVLNGTSEGKPLYYSTMLRNVSRHVPYQSWWLNTSVHLDSHARASPRNVSRLLFFDGIDYNASVYLNGRLVGAHIGAFRTAMFDASEMSGDALDVAVRFHPPPRPFLDAWLAQGNGAQWEYYKYLTRWKSMVGIGYDFAVPMWTVGLWRGVRLVEVDAPLVLTRLAPLVSHVSADLASASLQLNASVYCTASDEVCAKSAAQLRWSASCTTDSHAPAASLVTHVRAWMRGENSVSVTLTLTRPALWHVRGIGPQHRYEARLELLEGKREAARSGAADDGGSSGDRAGKGHTPIDAIGAPFGVRRLEMAENADTPRSWTYIDEIPCGPHATKYSYNCTWPPAGLPAAEVEGNRSWTFQINGRRVFAHGANWLPCDMAGGRCDAAAYDRLLGAAAHANINVRSCRPEPSSPVSHVVDPLNTPDIPLFWLLLAVPARVGRRRIRE